MATRHGSSTNRRYIHSLTLRWIQLLFGLLSSCLALVQRFICISLVLKSKLWSFMLWLVPPPKVLSVPEEYVPQHIAAAFLEETLSIEHILFGILEPCIKYGILKVSLYDPPGMLLDSLLPLASKSREALIAICHQNCLGLKINGHIYVKPKSKNLSSESTSSELLDLRLYCQNDSKGMIVDAVRELADSIKNSNEQKSVEIIDTLTTETISEMLKNSCELEEPSFIIKFGGIDSIMGYPLWALRVAEIIMVPSHLAFTAEDFTAAIEKFLGRDRRFGK